MEIFRTPADQKPIPIVLDARSPGATPLRDAKTRDLLAAAHIHIFKGNVLAIAPPAGANVRTKGASTAAVVSNRVDLAKACPGSVKRSWCLPGAKPWSPIAGKPAE